MGRTIRVPVDHSKLLYELSKRNLSTGKVSVEMGHHDSFLSHNIYTGTLRASDMKLLETMYNINHEDVAPDPKPEPTPEPTPVQAELEVKEALTLADRLCIDKLSKSIEDMRLTTHNLMLQVKALSDSMALIAKRTEFIDNLTATPDALYKSIFMPIYNAVKTADIENTANAELQKRRIDGSPIPRGGKF